MQDNRVQARTLAAAAPASLPQAAAVPAAHVADDAAAREPIKVDLCVIGAGAGGIPLALGATSFGLSTVLIEKHKMGGDGLNYGSVPSKTLVAMGRRAQALRTATDFGLSSVEPHVDPFAIQARLQDTIAGLGANVSGERLAAFGVRVMQGAARFIDKRTVGVGDFEISARRFVIATGSSPVRPQIEGLENVPYFTNETLFASVRQLKQLIVIGGGPTGLELAQAYRRLGTRVIVLEAGQALAGEDPELARVVLDRLRNEDVEVRENARAERVETMPGFIRVHVSEGDRLTAVDGTDLLIAAGRRPNIGELGLERAGIKFDERGIKTDRGLKTSNGRVFALGGAAGHPSLTHLAEYHADVVLRRILFRLPTRANPLLVPRVVHTEPELAHVGRTEAEALAQGMKINVVRWPFQEIDRAHAEQVTDGHVKVVTDKQGSIVGATIVGPIAGELIQPWALALANGLTLKAMSAWVAPYPTFGEINKRVASRWQRSAMASPVLRNISEFVRRFG